MNLGGLFDFVLKRLLGKAINVGIDRAIGGGRDKRDMSPEERRAYEESRKTARRARQASKLAGRIMRR